MKLKLDCEVIQDMLPLYEDQCCSEKTKELVEFHLKDCKSCQMISKYYKMDLSNDAPPMKEPDTEIIKAGMKKLKRRRAALCVVPVAIVIFFVFLYHALMPFQTSVPYDNCRITIVSVGEPEENDFVGGLAQTIQVDVEYSSKINKDIPEDPGTYVLWEDVHIQSESEIENVILMTVGSRGIKNKWTATHSNLSNGTKTYRDEIFATSQDATDTVDAIYYVEDLEHQLRTIYRNAEPDQDIPVDTWTKLVEENGQLVWSSESK